MAAGCTIRGRRRRNDERMEFRNHQVWVSQRLAMFQGRPLAMFALFVVLLLLIPVILVIGIVVLAFAIVGSVVRALLGAGAPRRVPPPHDGPGDPSAPPRTPGSPPVIDVDVTRSKSEP